MTYGNIWSLNAPRNHVLKGGLSLPPCFLYILSACSHLDQPSCCSLSISSSILPFLLPSQWSGLSECQSGLPTAAITIPPPTRPDISRHVGESKGAISLQLPHFITHLSLFLSFITIFYWICVKKGIKQTNSGARMHQSSCFMSVSALLYSHFCAFPLCLVPGATFFGTCFVGGSWFFQVQKRWGRHIADTDWSENVITSGATSGPGWFHL